MLLDCRDAGTRPVGKKRVLRCAELVLDVEPKTQRVILKKKVGLLRPHHLTERVSHNLAVWPRFLSLSLSLSLSISGSGSSL